MRFLVYLNLFNSAHIKLNFHLLLLGVGFVYGVIDLEDKLLHFINVRLFGVDFLLHFAQLITVLLFVIPPLVVKLKQQILVGSIFTSLRLHQFVLQLCNLTFLDFKVKSGFVSSLFVHMDLHLEPLSFSSSLQRFRRLLLKQISNFFVFNFEPLA